MSRNENLRFYGDSGGGGSSGTRDDPERVRIERGRYIEEIFRRCYDAFMLAGGSWIDQGSESTRRRIRFVEDAEKKSKEEVDMMIAMLILGGG